MKTLLLALLFSFAGFGFTSFSTSVKQAQDQKKNILIVFSGSDWCKPCISLKQNVLDTEEFRTYSNANLVLYIADFPRDASGIAEQQRLENEALAETYNPHGAFPSIVLLDSKQKMLKQHAGTFVTFTDLKQWLEN